MLKLKRPLLIALIIILNILIYYWAYLIEPETKFAECARNSGRISAAINLILLLMLGHLGLKTIYKEPSKMNIFQNLIMLFTINHLIHFFFVSQNFKSQATDLNISDNLHGFLTFIALILMPIIVYTFKKLSPILYGFILIYFFNITYFISISFYARYKPEDPAYLHRIGIIIMIIALFYILFRVFKERLINFKDVNN